VTYRRVVPRDLFNEADLLKCYARLWIRLEETPDHRAVLGEGDGSPFQIEQDPASGALTIVNLPFTIHGTTYQLTRPLNSRGKWPLYAESDDGAWAVFGEWGDLSEEFLALIREGE
jgi:hypothetical protein